MSARPLLVVVALAAALVPARPALAGDITTVTIPLYEAKRAYEKAWRACFALREGSDLVFETCDRARLRSTYEAYHGRWQAFCASPHPHTDPFAGTEGRSWSSDEFKRLQLQQSEFRVWVELCSWTDRATARSSNLFTWQKDSSSLSWETTETLIAESVFRSHHRAAASEPALWWFPYEEYVASTERLCRYLAKFGRPEFGHLTAPLWTQRCAASDLMAFALDPAIFPPKKPSSGSGGLSLDDLTGDGAATTGGTAVPDERPPADEKTETPPTPPPAPRAVKLTVTLAGRDPASISAIPVPSTLDLVITGVDADTGEPARLAKVDVSLGDVAIPFARVDDGRKVAWDRLDDAGRYTAKLVTRVPRQGDDYLRLTELPLSLTLTVTLKTDEGTRLAHASWTRPFNLTLYHGFTVGPDLAKRAVAGPPAFEYKNLVVAAEAHPDGGFGVLVTPAPNGSLQKDLSRGEQKLSDCALTWPDKLLLRLSAPPVRFGARFDIGLVDALTAAEHEERIRAEVRAFVADMRLSPEWKKDVIDDLARVRFEYDPDAGGGDTVFKDGLTSGGRISVPYRAEDYWVHGSSPDLYNPAFHQNIYVIVLHELGHWLHKRVVERHPWLHIVHAKLRAGGHKTWDVDADTFAFKRPFVAWMEATADTFAYLAFAHWERRQAAFAASKYHVRGYLDDFASDTVASQALERTRRGDWVEGLHTRYWLALYGGETRRRPALVFADLLATMLQFTADWDNWEGGIHAAPARTIDRWVWTKANTPSHLGLTTTGDPYTLAARYRLIPEGEPTPTVGVLGESPADVAVEVDGKRYTLADTPVVPVPPRGRLRVVRGPVALDVSSAATRMMVRLETGAVAEPRDAGLVALVSGDASAVGPVSIVTPTTLAQAIGTVFR
ncbi:MAG: hypothetical protein EP329_06250, partial [Deltaproteobacteria bacterium]